MNENECTELLCRDGESYAEYYERLLAASHKADEARKTHERWKLRHWNGITENDCEHRILFYLRELLRSSFLQEDYFDTGISRRDRQQAHAELDKMGFYEEFDDDVPDGADRKYALFRLVLRVPDEQRQLIAPHAAGLYIDQMHAERRTLSDDDMEACFRFASFSQLAYEDIDHLRKQHYDQQLVLCIGKMKADIESLREHVVNGYADNYDQMLDEMLQTGEIPKSLKQVSPNGFKGGYNQKLACNLVGLMCSEGVYDVKAKQADNLIYTDKTHYTYINQYADYEGTNSCLKRFEVETIKKIIKSKTK